MATAEGPWWPLATSWMIPESSCPGLPPSHICLPTWLLRKPTTGVDGAEPRPCGYRRRAMVAVGHVMDDPRVFVSGFAPIPRPFAHVAPLQAGDRCQLDQPCPCGYHRRAGVAAGHFVEPPRVFTTLNPMSVCPRRLSGSQGWALTGPDHVPVAPAEGLWPPLAMSQILPESLHPCLPPILHLFVHVGPPRASDGGQLDQTTSPWLPQKGCSSRWPH
nr:PREDICTED: uncharacterized protein LOC106492599 isoform X1 [Apteryx mantelli mantelli]XP_013807913.1 PREDICTED: uncharacterized protein LOC106492599 isoform X2 [Apteryx mantelli mantelli]